MPRLVVLTDDSKRVLMDEKVEPIHLNDTHCAEQFIERLAWAMDGRPPKRPAREPRHGFPWVGFGG